MSSRTTFDEVLEAVEHLPPDQQADLLSVIQRRLAERGRHRVIEDVRDAREDFKSGAAKHASASDIVRELES